jgi:hypothetical protein
MGPRAGLDAVAKRKNSIIAPAGIWNPVVQPVLTELPRLRGQPNVVHVSFHIRGAGRWITRDTTRITKVISMTQLNSVVTRERGTWPHKQGN